MTSGSAAGLTGIGLSFRRACATAFLLALLASVLGGSAAQAGTLPEEYSLNPTEATLASTKAGAHSDFETRFEFEGDPTRRQSCFFFGPTCVENPWANLRDAAIELPPGLIGNQSAFPNCDTATFFAQLAVFEGKEATACDSDTQVGWVSPGLASDGLISFPPGIFKEPLYNLEAPGGDSGVVARFGFMAVFFPMFVDVRLDPKRSYGLTATIVNTPQPLVGHPNASWTHLWGVPTDPSHDNERFSPVDAIACGGPCSGPVPSGLRPTPLMANPTSCGPKKVGTSSVSYDRWREGWIFDSAPLGEIVGCESVPFEPTVSVAPTTRSAGTSTGLEVELDVPQPGMVNPLGKATAHVKKSVVTLPQGVTLNASSADGLGSCSEEEIGVDTDERQIVAYDSHGAPTSLSFGGQVTPILPQRATAAQVQSALEGLSNIGPGDIAVSGRLGGPWTVDFGGSFSGQDVPFVIGTNSELQRVAVHGAGGTYKLTFEGDQTPAIPYNATAAEVQAALEALPSIGSGQIALIGGPSNGALGGVSGGFVFRVAFTGTLSSVPLPMITADQSALVAGGFGKEGEAFTKVDRLAEGGSTSTTEVVQEGGTLRFNGAEPKCPESSKIASGELVTPVLNESLRASFYLARQSDNPFDSLFAGYLVAKGAGALIKMPARIDIDPDTGQLVTTFEENPEQPFSSLTLRFKSGNRGLLTTPSECGTYASTYELTPWSGQPPVTGSSAFTLDENCAHEFAPRFSAGSESPLAGAFTTLVTRVTRAAATPVLTGLSVTLPPGLTAKLAGIPYCPDSALAQVSTTPGTAAAQNAAPSCPGASKVGTVNSGTGSGTPFYINGNVYLAGPYKGAPISLAALVPASAGPLDLGSVLVRAPVRLDPVTAQVQAVTDPLPTMIHGVPIDLRDLRVNLDRPAFALNPTSCTPKQVTAKIDGAGGLTAHAAERFQIGECAALGLKPKISLRFKGGTRRAKHPALTVILRPRLGDADLSSISVTFPESQLLDQGHIVTVCTRVQFAADSCPAGSIYGSVSVTTPLLDAPLTGNVYLRSSSNPLPDLVTDLRGPADQPIRLEASGKTDTVDGKLRNTFTSLPDAPLTRVILRMKGGKKGLLVNNTNICAKKYRAKVTFTAHNGRSYGVEPGIVAKCGGKNRRARRKGH